MFLRNGDGFTRPIAIRSSTGEDRLMVTAQAAIIADGRALEIKGGDGVVQVLRAELLWRQCPSAAGRRRRIDGVDGNVPQGLLITAVTPVGRYGVNISFSDGHDRGIYPWGYLRDLQPRRLPADFIID